MDERRKIIIPIGDDPDAPSSKAFFDTNATNAARPVVPLPGTSTMGPAAKTSSGRKWKVIVVFLVVAASAAAAAVLYVSYFRSSGKTEAQIPVSPVASKTLATLPWTRTPEEPAVEENTETASNETGQANNTNANEAQARNQRTVGDQKKATKQKDRTKNSNKKNDDLPEDPLKRTQNELNRIRDIFEGTPP